MAERNLNWNGYQPPLNKFTAQYLVEQGYIADQLASAVVVPDDFQTAKQYFEQTTAIEAMWRAEWVKVVQGAYSRRR